MWTSPASTFQRRESNLCPGTLLMISGPFPHPHALQIYIKSWFALVNQVSNYAQLRDVMAIFRRFLSPKYKFFWTLFWTRPSMILKLQFHHPANMLQRGVRCRHQEIKSPWCSICLRLLTSLNALIFHCSPTHTAYKHLRGRQTHASWQQRNANWC